MTDNPDKLLEAFTYCRDFAKLMLGKYGSFHPFGATVDLQGEIAAAMGGNGDEQPPAAELIQIMTGAFRDQARNKAISGAAIAVDVNTPSFLGSQWPDGIRVRLESRGRCLNIYVPYLVKPTGLVALKHEVLLAEPIGVEVSPAIFIDA